MTLERMLQIAIATLTALATLMLGMGERNALFPLFAGIAAASSVYFTDEKRWLELKDSTANAIAIVAVIVALFDFNGLGAESHLLAITNLLVYLQCVLLYQRKTVRRYWLLLSMSLLEVAVATAISSQLLFSLLLVLYLFVGATSLALLLFVRQAHRYGVIPDDVTGTGAAPASGHGDPATRGRRWPLPLRSELLRPPVQSHGLDEDLTWRFGRRLVRITAATLALTMLLFLAVPRIERDDWKRESALLASANIVGISERIALDELGPILESAEPVMQVRFLDAVTGERYGLIEEPLFRGYLLTQYENGEWSQRRNSFLRTIPIVESFNPEGWIRQQITIEPLDTKALFSVFPTINIDPQSRVLMDSGREQLVRPTDAQQTSFTYELLTNGLSNGRRLRLIRSSYLLGREGRRRKILTRVPWDKESRTTRLAEDLIAELPPEDRDKTFFQARAIETYLRDSERFQYSLFPPQRDRTLDPVEDFLFENPSGHCEYFASALALLLRSVDIPARVVVGFKGGEYNFLGDFYQIRQLHAHAWVEAYLLPEDIPDELIAGRRRHGSGGWLVLDPTPSTGSAAMAAVDTGGVPSLTQLLDYVQFAWSSYVMGMDSRRQREAIYQPILSGATALADRLFGPGTVQDRFQRAAKTIREGRWFSWQAGLVAMAISLVMVGLWRVARWIVRRLIAWLSLHRRGRFAARHTRVAFYRRLEKLLARHKLVRLDTTTPREFATEVGGYLSDSALTLPAAEIPLNVVDVFYQVRFGGRRLDEHQTLEIQRELDRLQSVLATSRRSANGRNGRSRRRSSTRPAAI